MHTRNYQDIWGGLAMVAIGGFAVVYATSSLALGTLQRMGPGMFPGALGVLLIALGLGLIIPALRGSGKLAEFDLRAFVAVFASIFSFAMLVRPFGMVPAILAMTVIASQADRKLSKRALALMAACLAAVAVLIFKVGLNMQISIVTWPW